MSHGVLTRAPFLDHNLVTYMFSLPSKSKIGNGFTKRILRDSMKDIVPASILNRTDKEVLLLLIIGMKKYEKLYFR